MSRKREREKRHKKALRRERRRRFFKGIGTMNIILILVGTFFLWFNWQMLQLFRMYGQLPETYACAVIGATIGEAGICGWIRTTKDRKRDRDWEREDKQAEKIPPESEVKG